jgi:hypothetical protein
MKRRARARGVVVAIVLAAAAALALFLRTREASEGGPPVVASDEPTRPGAEERLALRAGLPPVPSPTAARDGVGGEEPVEREPGRVRIRGRVVGLPEEGAPFRIAVACGSGALGARTTVVTDEGGRFEVLVAVPRGCEVATVTGRSLDGAFVTYPEARGLPRWVRSTSFSPHEMTVVLKVRTGVRVTGRVSAEGVAAGARVLLTQAPLHLDEDIEGWNLHGLAFLDEWVEPGADGTFETIVRPGEVRARVVTRDGALGVSVSATARVGDAVDLGALAVPVDAVRARIRVRTREGTPVADAWVQSSDREVSVVASGEFAEAPHFVTDRQGEVRLPPLSGDAFPVRFAVKAPGYRIHEGEVSAASSETDVVLEARPRVAVRLVGPGALALDSIDLRSLDLQVQPVTPPYVASGVIPSPGDVLREWPDWRESSGVRNKSERVLWTWRPDPGEYWIRLSLWGVTLAERRWVAAHGGEESLDLHVGAGRPVTVETRGVNLPRPDTMQVRLASSRDPTAFLPLTWWVESKWQVTWWGWAPEPFDTVVWSGRSECVHPIERGSAPLSPETSIEFRRPRDTARIDVQVGTPADPGGGDWVVYVVPLDAACGGGIVPVRTGESGRAFVPVREGRYEIRLDRPTASRRYASAEVNARADRQNLVTLPYE